MTDDRDRPLSSEELVQEAQATAGAFPEAVDPVTPPDAGSDDAEPVSPDERDQPLSSDEALSGTGEPGIVVPATTGHPIESVGTGDAPEKQIDWRHFLFRFDGRINRAKFWLGLLIQWVYFALLFLVSDGMDSEVGQVLLLVGFVPLIWVSAAVAIKRWHDLDKSGWWVLIGLVPVIGPFWAIGEPGLTPGDNDKNRYGPDPLAAKQLPGDPPASPVRSRWRKVGVAGAIVFAVVVSFAFVNVLAESSQATATYNEGVEASEAGRYGDAIVLYTEVIESDPSDTDLLVFAYLNRSVASSQLGRFEEALADATVVIELAADDDSLSRGHLSRALALDSLGQTDEAVSDLRVVIELRPPDDELSQIATQFLILMGFSE